MAEQRIVVSGMGVVSALGNHVQAHLDALRTAKHGISMTNYLETIHKDRFPVGEIKHSNQELIALLNLPEGAYSRTELLGLFAVRQLLDSVNYEMDNRTGLISATTVGGMDQSEHFFEDYLKGLNLDYARRHPLGESTEFMASQVGIKAFRTTLSTACSSSANAMILGARLIHQGVLDKVIVGGVDALSKFTVNGFNSLMILDKEHCKPFDNERQGLNLGEAAAFLLIETEESARKAGRKIWSELKGYANTNDAYHQTASSPEGDGAFDAMNQALQKAGLQMSDMDYVNAHGTGTANNDLAESRALQRLFGDDKIPFSSTKAYTGHTLGAAGAIEAVISNLCINHKFIPASLNCKNPMEEVDIFPETTMIEVEKMDYILSNSFGFGGNNSALIFSSVKN
jgi:3-oxoacyl-[acyl-carrier-protein] synthase-1